jgi:hypothetical protein
VLYLRMWFLGSPDTDIVSVHLATDVECGFIGEDQSFYETNHLPKFSTASPHKIHAFSLLSAGVRACTNSILYGLKHSRLLNNFHTVIFGMPNSAFALAGTLMKHLTHSFNVVIKHTMSTRTPAFTQPSSFHKL